MFGPRQPKVRRLREKCPRNWGSWPGLWWGASCSPVERPATCGGHPRGTAWVLSRAVKQMRSAILVAYLPPVRRHEPADLCAAARTNLITP